MIKFLDVGERGAHWDTGHIETKPLSQNIHEGKILKILSEDGTSIAY